MLAAGDVVLVGFPYADREMQKYRPALVVSTPALHETHGVCWVAMITSAENAGWEGDLPIPSDAPAGLNKPSVIRSAKLTTLDCAMVSKIGVVSAVLLEQVRDSIRNYLAGN